MHFKKRLLISALSACMAFTVVACGDSPSDKSSEAALLAQYQANRLTKERLQEWVNGFQEAFPLYTVTLKSYEDKSAEQSLATISFVLGKPAPAGIRGGENLYINALLNLTIEHGVKVEDGVPSIARIQYNVELEDSSSPEMLEFRDQIIDVVKKLQAVSQEINIIQPDGEFYSKAKSTQPFEWANDKLTLSMPSYTSELQTYDGRKLLRSQVEIPSMLIDLKKEDGRVEIQGINVSAKDRPIRGAVYDLNGEGKVSIAKIEVMNEGKNILSLNGLEVVGNAKVDDQGLLDAQYNMKFSGQESISKKMELTENPQSVSFQVGLTMDMKNFHADSYLELARQMTNDPTGWVEDDKAQRLVADMLSYGPELNIEKLAVTLNGAQGEGSLQMKLPPLVDADKSLPLPLILMSKLEAQGSARIPVRWFELVEPNKEKREQLIVGLLMGFGGYVERKGDDLVSNFTYQGGAMTVNGRPFNLMR